MASGTRSIPVSLLDLTAAQVRNSRNPVMNQSGRLHRRFVQTLVLKPQINVRPGYLHPSSERKGKEVASRTEKYDYTNRIKSGPTSILFKRVEDLVKKTSQDAVNIETPEEEDVEGTLFYEEAELQSFYTDLLSHEQESSSKRENARIENNTDYDMVLEDAAKRLIVQQDPNTSHSTSSVLSGPSLANRLTARRMHKEESLGLNLVPPPLNEWKLHHCILQRATDVANGLNQTRRVIGSTSATVPIQILSEKEWEAITRKCIVEDELEIAEYALNLIKILHENIPERFVNEVMNTHAGRGDVRAVESLLRKGLTAQVTARQRDIHIKSHLKSESQMYNVHTALTTLHNYEGLALLPPLKSYTRCISALFSTPSAECHAQAWDLFSHMRYVAHAKPDPLLYALMIRACAGTGFSHSTYRADPVRALDLWTEMTMEAGYTPTVGAYNAIIIACARSKEYATEAFRLAREMLDSHRDAYGNPLLKPDRKTFAALLTAAKVNGDLRRTRWLLAELLSICKKEIEAGQKPSIYPDEEIMLHVLHSYNAYKPPFLRNTTKVVDEGDLNSAYDNVGEGGSPEEKSVKNASFSRNFTVTPPQTHTEVLSEVDALWNRILDDKGENISVSNEQNLFSGAFSSVYISTKLVNCYLAVHYGHDSIENSRKLFNETFEKLGVERSARSYVEALERCATNKPGERQIAEVFAKELWSGWSTISNTLTARSTKDARMIERAYVAMIRVLALFGDLDTAMKLLREFFAKYSPGNIIHITPKHEMRSSRTTLFASRPLVRLTVDSEVPDDTVPPLLTFRDLELLHHQLVSAGSAHRGDITFIKYVCKAYEGSLRKRRDATIRA